jgi:hypothetical protein
MPEMKIENSYIIIKGRFRAPASSSFGIFIVYLDNLSKNVDKYDIVSSHFSTLYENNVNMPWHELEEIISRLKWKGEYATSLTHDIQASFDDIFQAGTGRTQDIWSSIKKSQFNKVTDIFDEVLARPTTDKAVKCEIAIENIMKSDIEEARRLRTEREAKEMLAVPEVPDHLPSSMPTLEESAVVLEVSLVLSPIAGIPIYDLKEGDRIFIKISEQTSRGQYFIDLLNASDNNEIIPIPATVIKMAKEGKIYTVLVNIGPSIYGRSLDEDTVKVKRYDPSEDKRKSKGEQEEAGFVQPAPATATEPSQKGKTSMNIIFILIGITAFLVIIILIWLLF